MSRLAPIKEQCPEHITFDQIKVVIAILHRRFGMQVDNDSDLLTATAAVNLLVLTMLVLSGKMFLCLQYLCIKLLELSRFFILFNVCFTKYGLLLANILLL